MATASRQHLSRDEIKVMDDSDTHSALTAERYYAKMSTKETVSKAVKLTQALYERMDRTGTSQSSSSLSSVSERASVSAPSSASASTSASASAAVAASVAVASVPVIDPSQLLKLFTTTRRVRTENCMRDASGMYYVTRADCVCLVALI